MSLQVWIPFTDGTLKQQGVNNSAVSSGGTISLTGDGKLGKCVTFTSTAGGLTIPPSTMTSFTTECSVSFWLKINGWGSSYDTYFQAGTGSTPWTAYIFGFLRNGSGSTICFTIGNTSSASNNSYITSTMSTGVWYHVVLTYETGKVKIYLNGSLDKEYTTSIVPAFNKITKISVGRSNSDSSYQTQCSMNDLRIYDNCLSAQEVKEISKGLVLHYQLNPLSLINKKTLTSGYYIQANGTTKSTSNWYASDYIPIFPGRVYQTVELSHGGSGTYIATYNSSKTFVRSLLLTANENITFTANEGESYVRISIRNIAGELANAKFCDLSSLIYDSSGYKYNGTLNNTFEVSNETIKYGVSTKFTGTNYISLTSPTAEAKTLSIWVKWDTIPSGQSVVFLDYKSKLGLGLMSTGILCGTSGPGNFYTFSKSSLAANTWYHFVVVNTGTATSTTRDLYINGVKQTQTTSTSNWTYSVDQTQIGKRSTSSDGFVGLLSDVRLYTTALTANDILSLYNNGAYIDSAGNIHGKIR